MLLLLTVAVLFSVILVYANAAASSCGNGICDSDKGETWSNCVHDSCTTPDSDKADNNVHHPAPPSHPGLGHIHDRKNKVYRYHKDDL